MYTDKEFKKLERQFSIGMKMGRYIFKNHTSSRFHSWVKSKLIAVANKSYPKGSLDFLIEEGIWDEEKEGMK